MGFSMLGVSIPNFVMGPLLILLFSVSLGWLPVSGREGVGALILPALTLGTAMAAILSRMVRASLLEVLTVIVSALIVVPSAVISVPIGSSAPLPPR